MIVLGNIRSGAIDQIKEGLEAFALDEKYDQPAARRVVEVNPKVYDDYVGRYQVRPELIMTVKKEGDHLFLKGTGGYYLPLEPLSETKFFFKQFYVSLVFERNAEGKVTQILWAGQYPCKRISD